MLQCQEHFLKFRGHADRRVQRGFINGNWRAEKYLFRALNAGVRGQAEGIDKERETQRWLLIIHSAERPLQTSASISQSAARAYFTAPGKEKLLWDNWLGWLAYLALIFYIYSKVSFISYRRFGRKVCSSQHRPRLRIDENSLHNMCDSPSCFQQIMHVVSLVLW